ncbi:MAG: DUF1513 domain-containing protein [Pelagimonas sp.]|nr:DUF1513 domain-containing protein [Pelagimonas sp.]
MPSWADLGNPDYVSAARAPDGRHLLCGLSDLGEITFQVNLPARGHAAAPHPRLPHVVAFARRPGLFAYVVDCRDGRVIAKLDSPEGRHFYGHGVFSADGTRLYTTENDYENGIGVVGVWDAQNRYRRIDEFPSGGVGPHDIKRHKNGLVVANGGIETHPDTGRSKLNIPLMRPNLCHMHVDGTQINVVTLEQGLRRNSIRHLACASDTVAFAMQWEGDPSQTPPLLGLLQGGKDVRLLQPKDDITRRMRNYAGSIALSRDDQQVAITSPRGGLCQVFDIAQGTLEHQHALTDVCGVAPRAQGFLLTSGEGTVVGLRKSFETFNRSYDLRWDNHLVLVQT